MSRLFSARGARIGAVILAASLTAALIGCSSGSSSDRAADAPAETSELSGNLTIFAAASLEPAFDEISAEFSKENPDVTLDSTYDGSSVLATQILSGAPADVFASADEPNMAKVTDGGANGGDPVAFATSELAIAVAQGNPFGISSLADLATGGANGTGPITVVCAAEVPCGAASHTLLERDGVSLKPASEEQNVTAVLTKVEEGEADAGLVYYSDIVRGSGKVDGIEIENASDAAGDYLIVPVAGTANPDAARAFSEYLTSDAAQAIFAKLGFGPAR